MGKNSWRTSDKCHEKLAGNHGRCPSNDDGFSSQNESMSVRVGCRGHHARDRIGGMSTRITSMYRRLPPTLCYELGNGSRDCGQARRVKVKLGRPARGRPSAGVVVVVVVSPVLGATGFRACACMAEGWTHRGAALPPVAPPESDRARATDISRSGGDFPRTVKNARLSDTNARLWFFSTQTIR